MFGAYVGAELVHLQSMVEGKELSDREKRSWCLYAYGQVFLRVRREMGSRPGARLTPKALPSLSLSLHLPTPPLVNL